MRAAVAACIASCAFAGCELIANIPDHTGETTDGGGGSGDDGGGSGDDAASVDAAAGCQLDTECASGVCLVDGSCAMASQIVYASPAGAGDCSMASPCSFDTAVTKLAAGVDVIKLAPGVYDRAVQTEITMPVTIAGTGATFHGAPGGGTPTFYAHINVTAGTLVVIGLDFDLNGTIGATCPSGEIVLSRTNMHGGFYGLYSSGTCTTTIDRAVFNANNFYGAYFSMGTSVTITNSFFTQNATTGSLDTLAALIFEGATGTVSHSTFSANAGTTPAIHCMNSPNLKMASLISYGHATNGIEATCDVSYSVLDAGYAGPGTNNITTNPMFIAPQTGNYHLSPNSPVRGMGDPGSVMNHDVDGEPRPRPAGSNADPGADEVL